MELFNFICYPSIGLNMSRAFTNVLFRIRRDRFSGLWVVELFLISEYNEIYKIGFWEVNIYAESS